MLTEDFLRMIRRHQRWLDDGGKGEPPAWFNGFNLRNMPMYRQDLRHLEAAGSNLAGTCLDESDLRRADLSGANFCNATAREADFRGADLEGANFYGADLSRADFRRANIEGANFCNATLTDVNFDEIIYGVESANFCFSSRYGRSYDIEDEKMKKLQQKLIASNKERDEAIEKERDQ